MLFVYYQATSVVKLDKAEILELAVAHLAQIQQLPNSACAANHVPSYKTGFRECTRETIRYLSSATMMPNPVLHDLDNHLHTVCEISSHRSNANMPSVATLHGLLPERHCTSSPSLDRLSSASPMLSSASSLLNPFGRSRILFSPVSPIDLREHLLQSSMDSGFYSNLASPSGSASSMASPALSVCCSSVSDSSAVDIDANSSDVGSDIDESAMSVDSKSDFALCNVIADEKPWRPW